MHQNLARFAVSRRSVIGFAACAKEERKDDEWTWVLRGVSRAESVRRFRVDDYACTKDAAYTDVEYSPVTMFETKRAEDSNLYEKCMEARGWEQLKAPKGQ